MELHTHSKLVATTTSNQIIVKTWIIIYKAMYEKKNEAKEYKHYGIENELFLNALQRILTQVLV